MAHWIKTSGNETWQDFLNLDRADMLRIGKDPNGQGYEIKVRMDGSWATLRGGFESIDEAIRWAEGLTVSVRPHAESKRRMKRP